METVEVPQHLKCPVSLSLFVDPITVPCCNRVFSRSSLEITLDEQKICPFCFQDLKNFDIKHAPKSVAFQEVINAFIEEHDGNIEDLIPNKSSVDEVTRREKPEWKILLRTVPLKGPSLTKIGHLRVVNENKKVTFKTLVFNVVDESGQNVRIKLIFYDLIVIVIIINN